MFLCVSRPLSQTYYLAGPPGMLHALSAGSPAWSTPGTDCYGCVGVACLNLWIRPLQVADMGYKKTVALIVGLFVFWLACNSILRTNLGSGVLFFNQNGDWTNYSSDGAWYLHGQVPYRDTFSEYPQIPTYLFAVLMLFPPPAGQAFNFRLFTAVFSLLMMGVPLV